MNSWVKSAKDYSLRKLRGELTKPLMLVCGMQGNIRPAQPTYLLRKIPSIPNLRSWFIIVSTIQHKALLKHCKRFTTRQALL